MKFCAVIILILGTVALSHRTVSGTTDDDSNIFQFGKPGVTEISQIPWTPSDPSVYPKVIYGEDDRIDVFEETDPQRRDWTGSTCALIYSSRLTQNEDGSYTITSPGAYRRFGLPPCEGEPFANQPTAAYCSGFMVGPDLIATAGHCYSTSSLANTRFVFGFWMLDETTPRLTFQEDEVYQGVEVVSFSPSGDNDHSVVRVDRPIRAPGATPLPIRREGVIMPGEYVGVIGHPSGLPMKLAFGDTYVRRSDRTGFFVANLDTYGGNSGSPVINAGTGLLEGILVRGETDFINQGTCFESNRVANDGGRGEDVTKATVFAEVVPPLASHSGYIVLDSAFYQCTDVMHVRVVDLDLAGDTMIVVTLETSRGDEEAFALVEEADAPGAFTGNVPLQQGVPTPESGSIEVAHGDVVTVIYVDEQDATGQPATVVESAVIDCIPPTIDGVVTAFVGSAQARIQFTTDEPTRANIYYGNTCQALSNIASDARYQTSHSITLSGLVPDTAYLFAVEAVDQAGNGGYDDNAGLCYRFSTAVGQNYFTEYFDAGNPLDIAYGQVTFIPADFPHYYQACFTEASSLPMPPEGRLLTLGDDAYLEVPLEEGVLFPFYGTLYDVIYIGSNGYVTFGVGDVGYLALPSQHFLLPRIAGLMSDLNPAVRGTVHAAQVSDRYVITFSDVPLFDGTGAYVPENSNTFQMELFFDGMIRVTWLDVSAALAITGLSAGMGAPEDFSSISFSSLIECGSIEYEGSVHSADINGDWKISLEELLRVIQYFNFGEYSCSPESPDGYASGSGPRDCPPHDSDYGPVDWRIDLSELLRLIQLYNARGYRPSAESEDGFAPVP